MFRGLDDDEAELLSGLPSLTDFDLLYLSDLHFLRFTPNLRILSFDGLVGSSLPTPEELVDVGGVCQCPQLTELRIAHSGLLSSHMTAMLSCMPALSKLQLHCMHGLESLSFLESEPLQRSLTSLILLEMRSHDGLSAMDMRYVLPLQQLEHLEMIDSFHLDSFTQFLLTPPSANAQTKNIRTLLRGSSSFAELVAAPAAASNSGSDDHERSAAHVHLRTFSFRPGSTRMIRSRASRCERRSRRRQLARCACGRQLQRH